MDAHLFGKKIYICVIKKILWAKRNIDEKMIIILKGFIKQPVIKKPNFSQFCFVIACCIIVISLSL